MTSVALLTSEVGERGAAFGKFRRAAYCVFMPLVELSPVVDDGMTTYRGLPGPVLDVPCP